MSKTALGSIWASLLIFTLTVLITLKETLRLIMLH